MDTSTENIPTDNRLDDEPIDDDLDFEPPPGVDYIELTEEDVRRIIHELLAEAGITVEQLKEEAKTEDFSSQAARELWFWYDDCIDEYT